MSLVTQIRPTFKKLVAQSYTENFMSDSDIGSLVESGMLTPDDYQEITGKKYPTTDKGNADTAKTNSGTGKSTGSNTDINNTSDVSSSSKTNASKAQGSVSKEDTTNSSTSDSTAKSKK